MEEGLNQNPVPGSGSGSGSVDKSRALDVIPPVLRKPIQDSHFVQDPSCFSPFVSVEKPQESQAFPIPTPAPLRSYRNPPVEEATPHGSNVNTSSSVEGFNGNFVAGNQKRAPPHLHNCKSSQKRNKKTQESHIDSSSSAGISLARKGDGDREAVNLVLMTFDSLRRRLCQLDEDGDIREMGPDAEIKRPELKATKALMSKGVRTNTRKRVGVVPGVEVGDIFFWRMEMCLVGLHGQSMGGNGIDYMTIKDGLQEEPIALSIVSSGEYGDDAEDSDVLIYSGQGENFGKKDKHMTDQKLQRGNLALDRSLRRHNEVRVIRVLKDAVNKIEKIYVYDGLYKIEDSWIERRKSGGGVFKYKLVRMPGQPSAFAVWKSVQKWKDGFPTRSGLILADLSGGAESIPVSLVNDVDTEKGPVFFTYFRSLKYPKSFNPEPFNLIWPCYRRSCIQACTRSDPGCSCIKTNGHDFPYTGNGILVSRKQLVHECGIRCQGHLGCKNRVSQNGSKLHLEVFKTKDRGWGLRSLDPIRAGTYICEYAGEVIDRAKVTHNGIGNNFEYVFDTSRIYQPFKWDYEPSLMIEESSQNSCEDYAIPFPLIISAKDLGNVARFMNHSCSPNVFWQPILYEERFEFKCESFLHIAFFALKHVPPMTELTYDYGITRSGQAEGSSALRGKKKCLCGSSKCHGSFG